jgi:tripartite-type tricarboxylate transporter receptor subunit TctC
VPQPDDRQQELVSHAQVEVVAAANGALAAGAVEAAAAVGGEGGEQFGEQLLESIYGQPGQGPEDGGVLAQVLAAEDHGGLGDSAGVQLSYSPHPLS